MAYSGRSFSTYIIKYDEGLRSYILQVYSYMTLALALTGITAMFTVSSDVLMNAMYAVLNDQVIGLSPFGWLVFFIPIGIAFAFGFTLQQMSAITAQILFWMYSILLGLSLSAVFLLYTGESIASVFFITASIFGAMSLYGYITQRNLTNFGAFLFMGLVGVIVAFSVNLFLRSSGLNFAASILSVFIFTALTAADTQRIKSIYETYETSDKDAASKITVIGALTLYLDFINIFIHILQLFGKRKNGSQ